MVVVLVAVVAVAEEAADALVLLQAPVLVNAVDHVDARDLIDADTENEDIIAETDVPVANVLVHHLLLLVAAAVQAQALVLHILQAHVPIHLNIVPIASLVIPSSALEALLAAANLNVRVKDVHTANPKVNIVPVVRNALNRRLPSLPSLLPHLALVHRRKNAELVSAVAIPRDSFVKLV